MVVHIYRNIIFILVLAAVAVWLAVIRMPGQNLWIIACDVGQGDATLVIYKNIEILTDGGPNNNVMDCLGKYLPFTDREIELVILTHSDSDHYFGLIEVFKRYKVDNLLYNNIPSGSQSYQLLISEVGSSGAHLLNPDIGMVIRLGLISLDIVNPARGFVSKDSNDYSITDILTYGKFKAIFTGDLPPVVSDRLAGSWDKGTINYIKIPHHGSKTGVTENLLQVLKPKVAVISVGKNNTYGHPSPEILEMLRRLKIPFYRTDEVGDIVIETDGKSFWVKK